MEKALEMPPGEGVVFPELIPDIDYEENETWEFWVSEVRCRIKAVNEGREKLLDFHLLPSEKPPFVNYEVPVAIIFWEDTPSTHPLESHLLEIAQRMRAARKKMAPLGISVKELVEAGRER